MSKDKGTKNHKKSPADKSAGKDKSVSAYKSEGKSQTKNSTIDAFVPKTEPKAGGKSK